MSFLGILGGVTSVLGGLGSLGNKPKNVNSGQNLMHLAQGAREAADKYGFNPLTLLNAGAGTSGYQIGGTPPLASVEILTGGLKGLEDEVSGDASRRRAADQLNLDMARLKFDQARSGVAVAPVSAANAVGPSPLGNRPLQVYPANGSVHGGGRGFNSDVPVSSRAGGRQSGGQHLPVDSRGDPVDYAANPATRLVVGGVQVNPNPSFSDAEFYEQRYGELGGSGIGLVNIAADAYTWAYGHVAPYAGAAFNATHALDGFGRIPSASRPLTKLKKPQGDYQHWDKSKNPRLFNGGQ